MASQRRRAARPTAVRALVTSVMVGGSGEGQGQRIFPAPAPSSSFLGVLEPPPLGPLPPADPPPSSFRTLFIPRDPGPAPLLCPVPAGWRGSGVGVGWRLTVDCDQHAAAIRCRVNPVVSHALVFPSLAPLDVGNLQDLAFGGEAVCGGRGGEGAGPDTNT